MQSEFPLKAYRLKVITHRQSSLPLWSQLSELWLRSYNEVP